MLRQGKDGQELREIFSQLNPLNKGYALAVLRSLFFAQQHTGTPGNEQTTITKGEKQTGGEQNGAL